MDKQEEVPAAPEGGQPDPHVAVVKGERAIGISMLANVAQDRQITLQSYVALDSPEDEQNALLDKLTRLVVRQKAMADIPNLEDEIDQHHKALDRMTEDQGKIEAAFRHEQARRRAKVTELKRGLKAAEDEAAEKHKREHKKLVTAKQVLLDDRKALFDSSYKAFTDSGRGGEYTPTGHVAANLSRMDQGAIEAQAAIDASIAGRDQFIAVETAPVSKLVTDAENEITKAEAERTANKEQAEVAKRRYAEEIAAREAKISKAKRLINGGPAND